MSGAPPGGVRGKVVVITGASSGIGEASARLLAGLGAQVVLGARRLERLEALAREIVAAGGEAVAAPVDVTRREDLQRLVSAAQERFGRLDVLVASAGVGPISPLDALRVAEWDQMVEINLKGVLHGVAAALPVFRAQGVGDPALRGMLVEMRDRMAIAPEAVARAIAYALEQPEDVDVGEIVIRPTAQA